MTPPPGPQRDCRVDREGCPSRPPSDPRVRSSRTLWPILKDAGFSLKFRPYDCRHTCACVLLAADENPRVVSERLGHSNVVFTLDRHAHVIPGQQKAESEKLGAMLFGEE